MAMIFYKSRVGVYNFDGKAYDLQPTSDPNIGVIYEHAFFDGDYTPVIYSTNGIIDLLGVGLGVGGVLKKG